MIDRAAQTARRAIDKAELFELMVGSSTDFAIFTIDPHGAITSWNVGAAHLFGYTEAQALGSPFSILFTPEDQRSGRAGAAKASSKQGLLFCKKEAKNFWVRCRGVYPERRDSGVKSFWVPFSKKGLLALP